jgi:hypothetical protein
MKKSTVWIVTIVVLAGLGAWYFNARQPIEDHPSVMESAGTETAVEPKPEIEYPVEAIETPAEPDWDPVDDAEPEPLPELASSDPVMAELLNSILGNEALTELVVTEQFINRIVATVDSLPSRKVAPLVLPVRPPAGKFKVNGEQAPFTLSPENDARYAPYVELIEQLDVDAAVRAYVRYYPLFQEAYQSLGYPDGYFNDRLVEVIDHLLQTPEPARDPYLEPYEAVYVYQDEKLEGLSAGQKTLLRIGADNRQDVRGALQRFRDALTRGWTDGEVIR